MIAPLARLGAPRLRALLHAVASDSRMVPVRPVAAAAVSAESEPATAQEEEENLAQLVLQLEASPAKSVELLCRVCTVETAQNLAILLAFLAQRHRSAVSYAMAGTLKGPFAQAKLGLVLMLRCMPSRDLRPLHSLVPLLVDATEQQKNSPQQPSVLALALRDAAWALACVVDDGALGEHAAFLARLVEREAQWVPSPAMPLSLALTDLHASLVSLSRPLQIAHLKASRDVLARRGRWGDAPSKRLFASNSGSGDPSTSLGVHLRMRRACLAMGYGAEPPPPPEVRAELLQSAMSAVSDEPRLQPARKMAMLCVRCLVKGGAAAADVRGLVELLDDKDVVSRLAVELVADAAFDQPGEVLELLTSRLDASEAQSTREMALAVISRIAALRGSRSGGGGSNVDVKMASLLLAMLGDEWVGLRNASAQVFALVDPLLVVPSLLTMLNDASDKKRSAAQVALEGILSGHHDVANVMRILAQELGRDRAPLDRLLRLKAWPSAVPVRAWPELACVIVDAALVDSSSMVPLVRLAGEFVATYQGARVVGMVEQASGDVFARLAPLLVLSALPLLEKDCAAAGAALAKRMSDPNELAEVRALAAQLLAKLPPAMAWSIILEMLQDPAKIRVGLAGACHAVAHAMAQGLDADLCFPPGLTDTVWALAESNPADVRTGQGCAELLGLCAAAGHDAGLWTRLDNPIALAALESALRRLPEGFLRSALCSEILRRASSRPNLFGLCFLAAYLCAKEEGLLANADPRETSKIMANAIDGLRDQSPSLDAVKFMGALLAWPPAVLASMPPGHLASARAALVAASNANANKEARELAERLVATCFEP